MSTDNSTCQPATPRRATSPMRVLSSLFRTPTRFQTPTKMTVSRRNKRTRARTSSLASCTPSTPSTPSLPAIVLQTYSVSTDSIVLTALPSAPFCCHEDLLTMSREQLEGVVRALNTRLPYRMRIGPEGDFWQDGGERDDDDDGLSRMSEAEMKRRIEELVGIRAVLGKNRVSRSGLGLGARSRVPPAPKAVRTRDTMWRPYEKTPWEMEVDDTEDQADDMNNMIDAALMGSSPLAGRTKPGAHSRNSMLSLLPAVQEENELKGDDSESDEGRPSKRQRVFLGSTTQNIEQEDQVTQGASKSRLIENMDVSGSPLLSGDDAFPDNSARFDAREVATLGHPCGAETSVGVQAPLQRRRSARIQEIVLKRALSVDNGKETTLGASDLKSSILRPKTSASKGSPKDNPLSTGEPDTHVDSNPPRKFALCLPFIPTPTRPQSSSSPWTAPRILRSHSQRLPDSNQATRIKASLGRSQSERYPRASDLAFVTINRPRYHFARRKSNGVKAAQEDQELHPSTLATCTEPPDRKHADENSEDGISKSSKTGSELHVGKSTGGLSSALCSFLSRRARAPSTSTNASTLSDGGDSPARGAANGGNAPTAIMPSARNDGATQHIWEVLGRMAVDSA